MSEILFNPDEIRLDIIKKAYKSGMRYGRITPEMQIAPWLAIGLKRLEKNHNLTVSEIAEIDKMGGTDHPDPTLGI